jgi:hypothetical protein
MARLAAAVHIPDDKHQIGLVAARAFNALKCRSRQVECNPEPEEDSMKWRGITLSINPGATSLPEFSPLTQARTLVNTAGP